MKKHKIPGRPFCPSCLALTDGATQVHGDDASPEPGDFTVCAYCACALTFTATLQLEVTPEPFAPELQEARLRILKFHKIHGRPTPPMTIADLN